MKSCNSTLSGYILLAADLYGISAFIINPTDLTASCVKNSKDYPNVCSLEAFYGSTHDEDLNWVKEFMENLIQNKQKLNISFRLKNGSDEYRWVNALGDFLESGEILIALRDVDKEKKTEYALYDYYSDLESQLIEKAEEVTRGATRFKELVENINDVIWETDIEQRFTYISPKITNILGYTQDELLGKTAAVFLADKEMETINKTAQECVEKNVEFRVEALKYTHKNGHEVFLDVTGSLIFDDFSEPIGFRGIARDITEKKRAQDELIKLNETLEQKVKDRTEKLESAHAELENIFNASRDGIAVFDLETNFLDANPSYQKMLGYTKEELKGKSCISLSIPEDIEQAKKALQTVLDEGYVDSFEKKCIKKSGEKIYVQMSLALLPCKTKIIAATKDITIEKQYKEALSRYITLTDEHVISSKTSPDGTITYASQAFCRISGYTKNELIGKSHNILRHPDMPKSLYVSLWETIKNGKTWRGDIKNIRKNGSNYWTSNIISPEFDESGEHIGYVSIKHDVTDKKLLEEISITDELTKLYNRRHFNAVFTKSIDECHEKGDFLVFTIFDIDNFKKYNDTYGHSNGDETLKSVADTAKNTASKTNSTAFRIGGEEFAIICSASSKEECLKNVEEIKETIQSLQIPHEKNESYGVVTASFGVYGVDFSKQEKKPTMDEIYKTGDELLYKAKECGRNRIYSMFI